MFVTRPFLGTKDVPDDRRLETWAKTNMTRRHGRCRRGARLVAKVPHGRWRTLTFPAALHHDRITAPCAIDGLINGASFHAYIEQFLVPTLSPGDVVVMDNLGSHKGQAVRRLIRAAGADRPLDAPRFRIDPTVSSMLMTARVKWLCFAERRFPAGTERTLVSES